MNTTNEKNDPSKEDIIEAGRIFEKIIFGWDNPFEKSNINNDKENENIENKDEITEAENEVKLLKLIDAFKILNSNNYENDIDGFKKIIESKNLKKKEIDGELLKYIKVLGFNLDDCFNNYNSYKIYVIDCSRKSKTIYYIYYRSDNHNFKPPQKLKK